MLDSTKRLSILKNMENIHFDVLVIGGGITGAGIALDAVTRGMKTGLVEMQDFAAGTSSRSTKLVHGGLRYLKNLEFKVVSEVGKERAIVYQNGPHVTIPEWMLLPIFKEGTLGKISTSVGLRLYDFLAGVKKSERRKILNRKQTLDKVPAIKSEGLKGSGYYVEYRTDDARLTIEVIKKAVEQGAKAVNYALVKQLVYKNNKLIGVVVEEQIGGCSFTIYADKIVNAAGPWVDDLREQDHSKESKQLHLTKGIHLVFDQKSFPLSQAVYFDSPDGRMIFAIPREGKTYVGTTDTDYSGDIKKPRMTVHDRDYLLNAIRFMFPVLDFSATDIESSWAGLRPLIHEEGKNPSEISRKDEVFISKSGLISIAGGKLTGYRKMAEEVVDLLANQLVKEGKSPFLPCQTKTLPISGGAYNYQELIRDQLEVGMKYGLDKETSIKLIKKYGANVNKVFNKLRDYPKANIHPSLPSYIFAEVMYSMEDEMVVKPIDFFIRRTGSLFFNIDWVNRWKEPIIALMAVKLGWSGEQKATYEAELEEELYFARNPET